MKRESRKELHARIAELEENLEASAAQVLRLQHDLAMALATERRVRNALRPPGTVTTGWPLPTGSAAQTAPVTFTTTTGGVYPLQGF